MRWKLHPNHDTLLTRSKLSNKNYKSQNGLATLQQAVIEENEDGLNDDICEYKNSKYNTITREKRHIQ